MASNIQSLEFIFYDQSFHFYYGLGILVLALIFRNLKNAQILFGIGYGLFIDDVAAVQYIGNPSQNPISEYWSATFIIPILAGLFLLIVSEKRLNKVFTKK